MKTRYLQIILILFTQLVVNAKGKSLDDRISDMYVERITNAGLPDIRQ